MRVSTHPTDKRSIKVKIICMSPTFACVQSTCPYWLLNCRKILTTLAVPSWGWASWSWCDVLERPRMLKLTKVDVLYVYIRVDSPSFPEYWFMYPESITSKRSGSRNHSPVERTEGMTKRRTVMTWKKQRDTMSKSSGKRERGKTRRMSFWIEFSHSIYCLDVELVTVSLQLIKRDSHPARLSLLRPVLFVLRRIDASDGFVGKSTIISCSSFMPFACSTRDVRWRLQFLAVGKAMHCLLL